MKKNNNNFNKKKVFFPFLKTINSKITQYLIKRFSIIVCFHIKKGNKYLIENIIRQTFIILSKMTTFNKIQILYLMFKNLSPLIYFYQQRKQLKFKNKYKKKFSYNNNLNIPTKTQSISKISKWYNLGVFSYKKKAISLSKKYAIELIKAGKKESFSYLKLKEYYNLNTQSNIIFENIYKQEVNFNKSKKLNNTFISKKLYSISYINRIFICKNKKKLKFLQKKKWQGKLFKIEF